MQGETFLHERPERLPLPFLMILALWQRASQASFLLMPVQSQLAL
jgi:hypothetical protein